MSNRCPKCNEKLSPFYMKQNCPKCDTNLVYYDLENRLKADHEQAMMEQEAVDRVLNNIKASAFGGPLQIIRFILMFSPLAWMCLPIVKPDNADGITLISVIMGIINENFSFEGENLAALVIMACVILFSLVYIISSLFSVGKKAYRRICVFEALKIASLYGCTLVFEVKEGVGFYLVGITYVVTIVLSYLIEKKLNR